MVVIPVTLNVSQKAYAVVNPSTGLWGHRSSGGTVFAFSFEKATELARKVVGFHAVPPQGFTAFGHGVPAAARPVATPAPAPRQDANGEEATKKPRTVAQAAAWLGVCERNLAKCEAGLIGGDVGKYRKAVETAKATLAAAQERNAPLANDNDDINA
jgi:hypothetical protein